MKQYIVTEDVKFLMRCWSKESGFKIPDHQFFASLQQRLLGYLSLIFPGIVFISLDDLSCQLKQKIGQARDTLLVSIDQIYNSIECHLESNRIADIDTMEIIGEAQRPGHISLAEQVDNLPKGKPITIIDDGCFSGDTLFRIFTLMREKGLDVQNIIVGILIDRAENRFVQEYPSIALETVYEFNNVIDWVCERDFFVGPPLSGRTAGTKENSTIVPCNPGISLPYCLPFGDPIKGASVPPNRVVEYSRFIINLSVELWLKIGEVADKPVLSRDVPRLPKGIERDERRFVDALTDARNQL